MATVATAFATIFLAELPDKTMLATIMLSARFRRPLAVWLGAGAALSAQMVIAVTAGRLLGLLPDRPVKLAVATLFAIGAVVLWRSADHDEASELAAEGEPGAATLPWSRVSATVFGIVFVAEWGDLTQLATASLAAKGHAASVLVGATAAMLTVAAIGVVAGQALLRVIPAPTLHRVAAVVFAGLSIYFFSVALT